MGKIKDEAAACGLAVQLLTRVPLPVKVEYTAARFAASARYYPLVGVAIGLAAGLAFSVLVNVWPTAISVVLTVTFVIWMTGALHEDGFADSCDALGGGRDKNRALEIMRDSRLGTYGVIGLALALMTKVVTLMHMHPTHIPLAFIGAHAISRAAMSWVVMTSQYVRDAGTAQDLSESYSKGSLLVVLLIGMTALLPLALFGGQRLAVGMLVGAALGYWLMRNRFEAKLGGYTGDCLGATQQSSELGAYLGMLAALSLNP